MRNWKTMGVHGKPTVGLTIASYLGGGDAPRRQHQLNGLLHCLAAQTWGRWQALIVHDGPGEGAKTAEQLVKAFNDPRVTLWVTPEREGRHGHRWRQEALGRVRGEYLGCANDDGWYVPVYFEALLAALTRGARFAFCDCVHSHKLWRPIATEARRGRLDVGGWLAERELVQQTAWTDFGFYGDGVFIDAVVARCRKGAVVKVPHCLFVHN